MTNERLNEILRRFPSLKVAVVGDFFLDKYLLFDPEIAEVSLETGRTANQVVQVRSSPGAAGTVVNNLAALGAGEIIPVGFTGDDGEGYELRKGLEALHCDTSSLLKAPELHTPTYLKPVNIRIGGLEGEAERYDTKNRVRLPSSVEESVIKEVRSVVSNVDAVIIADQVEEEDCGIITGRMRDALEDLAHKYPNVVFFADSRARINLFRGIIVKPNEGEALRSIFPGFTGEPTAEKVLEAGRKLAERNGKPVFVTRSSKGMIVFSHEGYAEVRGVRVEEPTDPTGAGDSATAASVLTLASGGTPSEAALVANLVASITVQYLGETGTASPDLLPNRLEMWKDQSV